MPPCGPYLGPAGGSALLAPTQSCVLTHTLTRARAPPDTPVSLLGPTEEQLEAVRALHPVLAEVVDMCTAPDADARPSFADIVPQLAKVRKHQIRRGTAGAYLVRIRFERGCEFGSLIALS